MVDKITEYLKTLTIKSTVSPSTSGVGHHTVRAHAGKSGVKVKRHSNGKLYVHKKASENKYNNYKILYSKGIGVELRGYKDGEIIMKEVLALHKATKS